MVDIGRDGYPIDTDDTDYPTCPWCGHLIMDRGALFAYRPDGDSQTVLCGDCDELFTLHVKYAYSTEKMETK